MNDGGQFASARGKGEGGKFATLAMGKPSKGNGGQVAGARNKSNVGQFTALAIIA